MTAIRLLSIVEDTMVDGPGFRTTIYCAGCEHACPGCHNPQSWDMQGGRDVPIAEAFTVLAREIKLKTKKDIWCYTGFTFENLLTDARRRPLLEEIDVLVDGPFVRSLRDPSLPFRGSSNQRLIDVPASLHGPLTLWQG